MEIAVSTLLSTVAVHVREYMVPLYGSPTAPVMMVGGETTWVTERKEGEAQGGESGPEESRGEIGSLGEELYILGRSGEAGKVELNSLIPRLPLVSVS